jgi:hypothetical protein
VPRILLKHCVVGWLLLLLQVNPKELKLVERIGEQQLDASALWLWGLGVFAAFWITTERMPEATLLVTLQFITPQHMLCINHKVRELFDRGLLRLAVLLSADSVVTPATAVHSMAMSKH